MLVAPDTSPDTLPSPAKPTPEGFGVGAGFYLDAAPMPGPGLAIGGWKLHHRRTAPAHRSALPSRSQARCGIFGPFDGRPRGADPGLCHPDLYRSVIGLPRSPRPASARGAKAFAAIWAPTATVWREHDACALVEDGLRCRRSSSIRGLTSFWPPSSEDHGRWVIAAAASLSPAAAGPDQPTTSSPAASRRTTWPSRTQFHRSWARRMDIAGLDPPTLADSVRPLLDWRRRCQWISPRLCTAAGLGTGGRYRISTRWCSCSARWRASPACTAPGGLGRAGHPLWCSGCPGCLLLIEFFADKLPGWIPAMGRTHHLHPTIPAGAAGCGSDRRPERCRCDRHGPPRRHPGRWHRFAKAGAGRPSAFIARAGGNVNCVRSGTRCSPAACGR